MRNCLDASSCLVGRIISVAPKNSEEKKKIKIATKFAALTCVGALGLCGLLSTSVSAGPVPNPDPLTFLDDVDGSGFFTPVGDGLAIEAFDLLSLPSILRQRIPRILPVGLRSSGWMIIRPWYPEHPQQQ